MSPDEAVVVGVGMTTAVGLSAPEVAAAARAGTMRFAATAFLDHRYEPFTLAEVPEEGLPELVEALAGAGLSSRERRMLRLADPPLRECLRALPESERRPPLFLALPETETTRPLDGAAFLGRLALQAEGAFDPAASAAAWRGRAGGVAAVGRAAEWVRAGHARFVVAGGVDSYRDLYVLGTLDLEKRVKSAVHPDGFIPGEGAAFLLLCTRATAADAGLPPVATLSRAGEAEEPGHLYSEAPYRGDGLAAALAQLLAAGEVPLPIAEVFSSMNGESHWGKEWGVASLRNRQALRDDHGMIHPADSYGDTGAASGPLMVGLAALGLRGGYRRSPGLVYGSSDRGGRAAVVVSTS